MATIDVFAIGGQSNAVGAGTGGPSIPSGVAWHWWNGALAARTGDSIGSTSGSAWPAFARRYFAITGRPICFVPAAVSGSALVAAADTGSYGDWSSTGTLFGTMTSRVSAAMSALITDGWEPVFRGMLWAQGEADASAIQSSIISQADYQAGLEDLFDRFESEFPLTHIFMILTGTRTGVSDAAYAIVRDTQVSVTFDKPNGAVVHTTAVEFPAAGWLVSGSDVHWSQDGLNHVGEKSAQAIASGLCFDKQWAAMVGTKTSGAPLPLPYFSTESLASDRRMVMTANLLNVEAPSDGGARNIGIATNGGGIIAGSGTVFQFSDVSIRAGTGSPEGVVSAVVGSLYLRRNGGASTTLYVKQSGTGNTGWVAK